MEPRRCVRGVGDVHARGKGVEGVVGLRGIWQHQFRLHDNVVTVLMLTQLKKCLSHTTLFGWRNGGMSWDNRATPLSLQAPTAVGSAVVWLGEWHAGCWCLTRLLHPGLSLLIRMGVRCVGASLRA
jgi:hypothetical protein